MAVASSIIWVAIAAAIMGVLLLIGVGFGYWFWLKFKPKKQTWRAKIYQVGDGIQPRIKDKHGNWISDIRLRDLRCHGIDTLERTEQEKGIVIYKLLKLNKTTPEVTADCVDYWGEKDKEVSVLMQGENCTLLKKGYDNASNMIFRPLPYDKVNMIINQMSIRKDRLQKDKNLLSEILPYITIVISLLTLIGLAYLNGQAFVTISENNKEALKTNDEALIKASENYKEGLLTYGAVQKEQIILGNQDNPTPPPPLIE